MTTPQSNHHHSGHKPYTTDDGGVPQGAEELDAQPLQVTEDTKDEEHSQGRGRGRGDGGGAGRGVAGRDSYMA